MSDKLIKSVRPEEFKKLIAAVPIKDTIARTAFLLAYGSGLRVSEIIALKKENVYPEKIMIEDGKGGKDRVVPVPKGWKKYMGSLLPLPRTVRTLERKFKYYVNAAGLDSRYVFHSLRHGFATRLTESGVPINQVQLLMGHSNLSTTNVYTRASPTDALKNYEELF